MPDVKFSEFASGGATVSGDIIVGLRSGVNTQFTAAPPGATIAGDTGSISGNSLTIYADVAALNCGSSVSFVNSGTISTLNLTDASSNTFIGKGAGNLTLSGSSNTGLGGQSLSSLTTGSNNVAFGYQSLSAITTGTYNVAIGAGSLAAVTTSDFNYAIGYNCLNASTTGFNNIAIGGACLFMSTNDAYNIAIGIGALYSINGGSYNLAIGGNAGDTIVTGSYNLCLGYNSGDNYSGAESNNILLNTNDTEVPGDQNVLRIGAGSGSGASQLNSAYIHGIAPNTQPITGSIEFVTIDTSSGLLGVTTTSAGSINIAGDTGSISGNSLTIYAHQGALNCGSSVLFSNSGTTSVLKVSDTNSNTLIGNLAGSGSVLGSSNTALGVSALGSLTNGNYNIAVGVDSLAILTGGAGNIGIGYQSLSSVTVNGDNIGIGTSTLAASGFGSGNIAIGNNALALSTSGTENIAIGLHALEASVTDSNNLAIGVQCLIALNGGANNLAIGNNSLLASVSDNWNLAIGPSSLGSAAGGSYNIGVGGFSLYSTVNGENNTALGYGSGDGIISGSNNLFLGYNAGDNYTGSESNNILLNTNDTEVPGDQHTLRIGAGTGTGIFQLNKAYISGINGNTVSNTKMVTIDSSTNQLGVASIPSGVTSTTYVNSSPYTVLTSDDIILMDTLLYSAPMSVILPASPTTDGQVWTIKDWSGEAAGFNITVTVAGGANTIDGGTSFVLNENYQAVSFAYSVSKSTYSIVDEANTAGAITLNGDSGVVTGSAINIQAFSDPNFPNKSGSSVTFFADTSTSPETLVLGLSDNSSNTFLGTGAGNGSVSGSENVSVGAQSLASITSGANNVGLGYDSLGGLLTGGYNLALGYGSGSNYSGAEHTNILLASGGVTGESNVMRLGNSTGTGSFGVNLAYICGIYGATPVSVNVPQVMLCDNADNVTVIDSSTAGYVLTSNGAATPSFQAAPSGGLTWSDQATSFNAAVNNGYIATAALTATLPTGTVAGQIISFIADSSGTLVIQAATGQSIRLGAVVSATGGSATNSGQGDTMDLVYSDTTSTWIANGAVGRSWVIV